MSAAAVPASRSMHVICELARLASCRHCRPCRARTHQPCVTRRDGADHYHLARPGQVSGEARYRWQAMLAVHREGLVRAGIVAADEPGEACDDG